MKRTNHNACKLFENDPRSRLKGTIIGNGIFVKSGYKKTTKVHRVTDKLLKQLKRIFVISYTLCMEE